MYTARQPDIAGFALGSARPGTSFVQPGAAPELPYDHNKGWSWQHSAAVDEGVDFGGLAAGAAVTAGVVAALPFEAGAVTVAGMGDTTARSGPVITPSDPPGRAFAPPRSS
ncbi:hypothetical protein ACFV2U_14725 [Streptomyces sp. NPDC059697]|uniref:hypothetical protein n=1 Tax=Streptomyces sp. NPDC059697 TaxID=3346912 RepID=UPI00369EC5D4